MNIVLKSTMDMVRNIARSADIKIHRSFADFLADRIVQVVTQPSLLGAVERLASLLNTDMGGVDGVVVARFLQHVNTTDAEAVLEWLRDFPRIAAMIATQRDDDLYNECLEGIVIDIVESNKGVALPSAPCDVNIKVTCLSPLAHGSDNKAGNATIFRRMQVLSTTGHVLSLPFYAGNALRGQMRDLLSDHFISALGLTPSKSKPPCNLWFFHSLYAGGALEENSAQAKALAKKLGNNGSIRAEGIHELRDTVPPISVLGSALGNRIISGRVNVCDLRPQCAEWGNGIVAAGELFDWVYLTRREDQESHADGDNKSMIANTEVLKAGTVLVGGIDVSDHATDMEKSCIGMGLKLLKDRGYLGAENRRGLGNVQIEIENAPDSGLYEAYLVENKDQIIEYLQEIGALAK